MVSFIERHKLLKHLKLLIEESPAVAILGARQVGKTTLADQVLIFRRAGRDRRW